MFADERRSCCNLARIDWFMSDQLNTDGGLASMAFGTHEEKREKNLRKKVLKELSLEYWLKYKAKFLEKCPNREIWKGVPIADDYHLRIDFSHDDLGKLNDSVIRYYIDYYRQNIEMESAQATNHD